MGVEPRLDTTNAEASTTALSETRTKLKPPARLRSLSPVRWGHVLTGVCAILSAIVTATNSELIKNIEYQTQTLFFELRGPVAPPDNIVILAIDDESLLIPKQSYQIDPKKYSYLEPLQAFPWKRKAYAEAIDKLMQAGAKSVALDIEFPDKSSYGSADDERLRQTLQRYAGRVTLAAAYDEVVTSYGLQPQLSEPYQLFWTEPMSVGSINYPVEADGKVRRFSSEFRKILAEKYKQQLKEFDNLKLKAPAFDFDEAVLQAAQVKYPQPKGEYIYFYGPQGTFKHIPFWRVLEPESWKQESKYFKDKIVLIGATASTLKDFHLTPFSQSWRYPQPLSGIEIHASAIATLLQGKAIAQAMPNTFLQGILVLMVVVGSGGILSRQKGYLNKLGWTIGIVIAWGSISYITFVYGQRILPTAVPIVAIALSGVSYLTTEATNQKIRKRRLRETLSLYATSPIVQDIIRQHDDLQDLLSKQDAESSNKIIGGRYEIIKVLGAGGFGETYIAQDTQRPGKPICVVKQLKPDPVTPSIWNLPDGYFHEKQKH